jgi:hypothetical protein
MGAWLKAPAADVVLALQLGLTLLGLGQLGLAQLERAVAGQINLPARGAAVTG